MFMYETETQYWFGSSVIQTEHQHINTNNQIANTNNQHHKMH